MRIAVIGGGLQGIEATYLAKKAGWEVYLIDRRPDVPASGLCDQFVQQEIAPSVDLKPLFAGIDAIIPAFENTDELNRLLEFCQMSGIPFVFDPDAYAVSSSKLESNRLFERLRLPVPRTWPNCEMPLIAKPAQGSGSQGVRFLGDAARLHKYFPDDQPPEDWVVQQFLRGPVFSLEVIGFNNCYQVLQVTDLDLDAGFDCKRVSAPSKLAPELTHEFERIALAISKAINLNGIMDIEVVCCGTGLNVLEIDARLPSQTPIAVYGATGLNMVDLLVRLFCGLDDAIPRLLPESRGTILEHLSFQDGLLEIGGEHMMTTGGALHVEPDFFGADEAITNYAVDRSDWVATLIVNATDRSEAWQKRNCVIENIMAHYPVKHYLDLKPA